MARVHIVALVVGCWIGAARLVAGQTVALEPPAHPGRAEPVASPQLTVGDAAASIGLHAADRTQPGECCSGWSAGLSKDISGGYYWSDHVKTDVELGWPGETEAYRNSSTFLPNGNSSYVFEQHRYTGIKLSVGQQYQFGRNDMFHPFVGAGVEVERQRDEVERQTADSRGIGSTSTATVRQLVTRPFLSTGFKAYFSERTFFRSDVKVALRGGVDQITWKWGVGFDVQHRSGPPRSATAAAGNAPRVREDPNLWRGYAAQLRVGQRVRVSTGQGQMVSATLLAVGDDQLTIKPITRVPEPARQVRYADLEWLAPDEGSTAGQRAGAIAAGIGTGVGVFYTILFVMFALYGD